MVPSDVAMKQAKVRFNYSDYLLLPEGKRYEILDGELYVNAAPNTRHQRVSRRLKVALIRHVEDGDLGEVFDAPYDVILSDEDVVQPDIFFVAKNQSSIVGELNLRGTPNMVVEILSPGTRGRDIDLKRKTYARFGVQEYWIVDPDAETVGILTWIVPLSAVIA